MQGWFHKRIRLGAALVAVVIQSVVTPCWGAIPQHIRRIDFSQRCDITKMVQPIESLNIIRHEDVAKIIPQNMAPSDNGGTVASQILDFSLQNLFRSSAFANTDLGRSAKRVEQVMESDLQVGGENGTTKHVFKVKMKPVQTQAQINYEGFMRAQMSYQIAREEFQVEVSERLTASADVVLSHLGSRGERQDMLSLRLRF